MAYVTQDQALRLSNRIGKLEGSIVKNAGVLSVILSAPESFTNDTPAAVKFSSKVIESGIIRGDTQTGTFTSSEDCAVLIAYQQEIAHSNVEDQYHLDLYGNGKFVENIASCRIPAGTTATAVFAASAMLSANVAYSLMIHAGGMSGTHVPKFQNACNRLSIMVTGCSGLVGPQGRKGDKGDKGDIGLPAPQVKAEYSADGQSWHAVYAEGDDYIRFSADGGNTWGGAVYIRGRQGPQGVPGEGVPAGGAAGQVLSKRTARDYDTQWADAAPVVAPAVDNANDGSENETIKVWEGTQAEYDALALYSDDTLYFIKDEAPPTIPFTLDSMPVGFNMPWWSNTLPSPKYMFMEGQSLAGYPYAQAVFGDNMPDLRGRVMVHKSEETEFDAIKKTSGAKTGSFGLGAGYAKIAMVGGVGIGIYAEDAFDIGAGNAYTAERKGAVSAEVTPGFRYATRLGGTTDTGSLIQPSIVCRFIAKVIP